MLSGLIPRQVRNPSQKRCVLQIFNTFGIPTRTVERSLDGAESKGFLTNHFSNVGIRIFYPIEFSLDGFQLIDVFNQSLRARVICNDSLPSLVQRHFAPRSSLCSRNVHVNECPLT